MPSNEDMRRKTAMICLHPERDSKVYQGFENEAESYFRNRGEHGHRELKRVSLTFLRQRNGYQSLKSEINL